MDQALTKKTLEILRAIAVERLHRKKGVLYMSKERKITNIKLKELVVASNEARDRYSDLLHMIRGVKLAPVSNDTLTIITLSEDTTSKQVAKLREFIIEQNLPGHYLLLLSDFENVDSWSISDIDAMIFQLMDIRAKALGEEQETSGINIMTLV